MTPTADFDACAGALRDGSRTFHAASLLLPRRIRRPASALYAFCRLADDAVDQDQGGIPAIARLRDRLDRTYHGHPLPTPLDRAFADAIARHAIPRALFDALLEGLTWDATGRRYEDFSAVCAYAARVAGTVGAMMALLMGARHRETLARACDLGVAMQLSNIARDVGEDARAGRLYLPLAWLRDEGVDPDAWLAQPRSCASVARVVNRVVDAAQALYEQSTSGIAQLPLACRPGINTARVLYRAIGRQVARNSLNALSSRTVISAPRKAALILVALPCAFVPHRPAPMVHLAETDFLVEAALRESVAATPFLRARSRRSLVPGGLSASIARTIDLFIRLERRDGQGSRGSAD